MGVGETTNGVVLKNDGRVLEFCLGNLLELDHCQVAAADIIFLHTCLPSSRTFQEQLQQLLMQAKGGCRLLTLESVEELWILPELCPFSTISVDSNTRFSTSWSPAYGSHMHLYKAKHKVVQG